MALVLIADDDEGVRRMLTTVLRRAGHSVSEATNGEDALTQISTEKPQLVVSDLMMPKLDGYELVRRLRLTPEGATPVIFLSAEYSDAEAAELARAGGVVHVLRKPCAPGDILAAVEEALGAVEHAKGAITGSYSVRHLRLMTDKLMQQASELREANARLEAQAARLQEEVAQRALAAAKLDHRNRLLALLSGVNSLIVRVQDRGTLFTETCRLAVEYGRFRHAWIGLVEAEDSITPVAFAGVSLGSEDQLNKPIRLGVEPGRSMVHEALASQRDVVCNDLRAEAHNLARGESLMKLGYASALLLPLVVAERSVGVFGLYADTPGFFDEDQRRVLQELTGDVSFALDHIAKTEKLDYLAYYDALTGLANRSLLLQRLPRDLDAAEAAGHKLALVVFNIDRFASINDTLGRHVGDEVLKILAQRLRQAIGDDARCARLGADELAGFISVVHSESEVARTVADWCGQLFNEPCAVLDHQLRIAGRAGIALFPGDGVDAETLLRHAHEASRKSRAENEPYRFYTQDISTRTAERLALEIKLRNALERQEFVLHYQPKVDAAGGRLTGLEALIRWNSPDGLVMPATFIPLMEETGLIVEVGRWVVRRAIADRRRWLLAGLPAPRVAINVSSVELRKQEFLPEIRHALGLGGADPGIDVEVTESLIMHDVEDNIRKLAELRDMGVSIGIDDFGTGYSSLAYLTRLPAQVLKIDRSFVSTMMENVAAMTLVSMIISLARSLRLISVAEGVETEEQARMLRLLRCDQLQGYLFGRPLTFEQITELLRSSGSR